MSLDIVLIHETAETAAASALHSAQPGSSKGAVLLFHGLTGSPFELQKYAKFLYNSGYDVFARCLPGHGDNFSGIYEVSYKDWIEHAYVSFKELKAKYENVFIAGLCLGSVLALAVAEKYSAEISGVISLSATLFLDGWRLPKLLFMMPLALSTIFRFYYFYPECEPHGIKNAKTRAAVKKILAKGSAGMNDFPMTAIYELLKLSKEVRKKLSSITAPVILIHSQEDDLTSVKSSKTVYNNISSADKELIILYDSYHMVLYDNEKEFVFNKTLDFMEKRLKHNPAALEAQAVCF